MEHKKESTKEKKNNKKNYFRLYKAIKKWQEYPEKLKPKLNFCREKNLFLFDPLEILMQLRY